MRILVITNTPLSRNTSNGRTVFNALSSFSSEQLVNFYIHGCPDSSLARFYTFSDADALLCALGKNEQVSAPEPLIEKKKSRKRFGQSTIARYVRELVWETKRVQKTIFSFASSIKPDAIFVLVADAGFLLNTACNIAEQLSIPIISYVTEDHFFKRYDYIHGLGFRGPFFSLFQKKVRKGTRRILNESKHTFFLTDGLRDSFLCSFPNLPSSVLYNSSSLEFCAVHNANGNPVPLLVYAGSTEAGRAKELVKIGRMMAEINPKAVLHIYSPSLTSKWAKLLNAQPNICVLPPLAYNDLLDRLHEADVLLHVDGTSAKWKRFTRQSFSTKIPDCLASGICFVVRTNPGSFTAKYLLSHQCAYCATNDQEMFAILEETLVHNGLSKYTNNAIEVAKRNHDAQQNSKRVYDVVCSLLHNKSSTTDNK